MLAPWQALVMTVALFPGICLITWAGYTGWAGKSPRMRDLSSMWSEFRSAKPEGLKEFVRTFMPTCPFLGYILLLVILFLIPTNTVFLGIVNICALPAAIVSYLEGRKFACPHPGRRDWHDFDLPLSSLLLVLGAWLSASACVLVVIWIFGGAKWIVP